MVTPNTVCTTLTYSESVRRQTRAGARDAFASQTGLAPPPGTVLVTPAPGTDEVSAPPAPPPEVAPFGPALLPSTIAVQPESAIRQTPPRPSDLKKLGRFAISLFGA